MSKTKLTEILSGNYSKNKKLIKESHGRMYGIVYPQSIGAFGKGNNQEYEGKVNKKNQKYVKNVVKNKNLYSEKIRDEETRKQIKKYLKNTIKEAQAKIDEAEAALEQIEQIQ